MQYIDMEITTGKLGRHKSIRQCDEESQRLMSDFLFYRRY